jgi:acyl-CoA dehydrogenase
VPLFESSFLAGWICEKVGRAARPRELLTVLPSRAPGSITIDAEGRLHGTASGVGFASAADTLVAIVRSEDSDELVFVPSDACRIVTREPEAFAWGDEVDLTGVVVRPEDRYPLGADLSLHDVWCRGALGRAVQLAGALERALDLSVAHARQRQQFGRPISQFQAVRDHLAVAAREVALARAAVDLAARAVERAGEFDESAVAAIGVAKTITSAVAGEVSTRTHQVHGAIGTTREYPLHVVTAQLASWRDEFGDEREWAHALGAGATAAASVWEFVTDIDVVGA